MIRYSEKSDIKDIIFLWNEAFGDSQEEIMFFINNKYKPENTLVFEDNSKIVSMLFLLEGEMKINNNRYPSYYLYAACTLNDCRGKGYMSQLLGFAKKTAYNRGYYFICLLPANKSLYEYYKKYGYKPLFKKKILSISSENITNKSDLSNSGCSDLFQLRENAFKNIDMFVWDGESLNFAFEHHKLYGGQAEISRKGYSLYTTKDKEINVKEFCFTDIFDNLPSESASAVRISINLPVDYAVESDNYEIIDSGMILAVNDDAEKLINEIKNPYLGLTLD